jgi:hypothetical protein
MFSNIEISNWSRYTHFSLIKFMIRGKMSNITSSYFRFGLDYVTKRESTDVLM